MVWTDWIRVGTHKFPLSELRSDPDRFRAALSAAKLADGHGWCLCRSEPLRLVIRVSSHGRTHVACWPFTGPTHDPRCAFYRVDPELSGKAGYTSAAIRDNAGVTAIRLAHALVCDHTTREVDTTAPMSQPRGHRITVGLAGLLHHLWDAAGLSAWPGGRRSRQWRDVVTAVDEQLGRCEISGLAGNEVGFVVPPFQPDQPDLGRTTCDSWLTRLHGDEREVRRGLVLGEIRADVKTSFGRRYQLAHLGGRYVYCDQATDERLKTSFRHVFAEAGRKARGRQIVLFLVERSTKGYIRAISGAAMLVTDRYIPADSSFEVLLAHELVSEGRSFWKPLRFDAASEEVFPDFVLTDERAVVEVWGMQGNTQYEDRKVDKLAIYARTGMKLYQWNVNDSMPDLRFNPTYADPATLIAGPGDSRTANSG